MDALIGAISTYQTLLFAREHADRQAAYEAARAMATQRGLPLLNVGCGTGRLISHPCGDVCLDLNPHRLTSCNSARPTVGDVRRIPFPDGYFGAAVVCHVLEHLPTVDDGYRALSELQRVAGYVWICSPSPLTWGGWVVPDHHLWVHHGPGGTITFEQRHRGEQHGEWWHPLLRACWDAKERLEVGQAPGGALASGHCPGQGCTCGGGTGQ